MGVVRLGGACGGAGVRRGRKAAVICRCFAQFSHNLRKTQQRRAIENKELFRC